MTNPKRKLRGTAHLGEAIDERIAVSPGRLDLRHDTGAALPEPVSGGGAGSGGGGDEPAALPETFVESLKKEGEAEALKGGLVLAAQGDTTLLQSGDPPHFTVATPVYGAADGVKREGDGFSCDSTVVRTSGDQAIGGVKTFGQFPVTPQGPPLGDFEVANKKYVDDEVVSHWQRVGTTLKPATSGDNLEVENTSGSTAVKGTGSTRGGLFTNTGVHPASAGVLAQSSSSAGAEVYGVQGVIHTGNTHNAAYSVHSAQRTFLGTWADSALQSAAPVPPTAGKGRWYCRDDGRAYLMDDAGNEHDLSVEHKETFWPAGGESGGDEDQLNLPWAYGAAPGVVNVAAVTAAAHHSFSLHTVAINPATLSDTFARFGWTSQQAMEVVTHQAQVVVGVPCRLWGQTVTVRARLRAGRGDRLAALYLSVNDCASPVNVSQVDVLGNLVDGVWCDAALSCVDVGGWTAPIRIVLTAVGTSDFAAVGATELDVACIAIEQWVK